MNKPTDSSPSATIEAPLLDINVDVGVVLTWCDLDMFLCLDELDAADLRSFSMNIPSQVLFF